MAAAANFPGDIYVEGSVYARGFAPAGSTTAAITNALISATADIDATKMEHQYVHCVPISNHGSAPAAVRKTICRVRGTTGTIVRVEAGVVQPLTVGSVTVDVYKNGSTVLSGTISVTTSAGSGGTAYDAVVGTLAATTLAQGDVLEAVVTVSTPTGGGGFYVQVTTREDPA